MAKQNPYTGLGRQQHPVEVKKVWPNAVTPELDAASWHDDQDDTDQVSPEDARRRVASPPPGRRRMEDRSSRPPYHWCERWFLRREGRSPSAAYPVSAPVLAVTLPVFGLRLNPSDHAGFRGSTGCIYDGTVKTKNDRRRLTLGEQRYFEERLHA